MSNPLVSVHIIIYNVIEFIRETLESALQQDYDNLEVIAADDRSTDGTAEVIREYADRYPGRLVPVLGEQNLGHTGNSNRALRACKGKYIAFQGGDDVFLPGKIRKQVEWMEEDERRVLCGHEVEAFDADTGRRLYLYSDYVPLRSGRGAGAIIRHGVPFGATSIMVRSSSIPPHGFDTRIPIVSDWILWIECLASGGEYGYIPGVYARYRRHANNITKSAFQERQDDLFTTLAIAESRYPHLIPAVRYARSRVFRSAGMRHMRGGDRLLARLFWQASLRERLDWKSLLPLGLTYMPSSVASWLIDRVRPAFTE